GPSRSKNRRAEVRSAQAVHRLLQRLVQEPLVATRDCLAEALVDDVQGLRYQLKRPPDRFGAGEARNVEPVVHESLFGRMTEPWSNAPDVSRARQPSSSRPASGRWER